jgi:DNA-binding transcriptional LysR family regulator
MTGRATGSPLTDEMFEILFSKRGLSLDRLRVVVELQHAGSFAQAAPGDAVRQSQFSRQLRDLSEFFGCELAERRGKVLKLTSKGEQLAAVVWQQMRALDDFHSDCRSEHAVFSIGAGDSLVQWLVIPRLGEAARGPKGMRFATYNLRTNEIIRQLSDCRLDFGLVRKNAVGHGLKAAPLGRQTYAAIVPKALSARRTPPSLNEVLSSLPLTMQTTDGQFSSQLREIAEKLGIALRPALSCQSFPQTMAAVASGQFAAILPQIAVGEFGHATNHTVSDPLLKPLERDLVLAWNPRSLDVRPGARAALTRLQSALKFS